MRPSVSVLDAAVAAVLLVCFFGAPVCDNALPAADLDVLPVEPDDSVVDAFFATGLLVTFEFFFAMFLYSCDVTICNATDSSLNRSLGNRCAKRDCVVKRCSFHAFRFWSQLYSTTAFVMM
ncbi:hypothetical protein [Novipirellula artificiosorum]|uniref:hypothetical protein n=1 Tax=Novipirellula artificiosorum TaxID=2528016 RepID=UPI0018CE516C|nr:hypothetical protein [Novipirellula artificiosorum]